MDETYEHAVWLTGDEFTRNGYDEDLVARLPLRELGHRGAPCWRSDEVDQLLAVLAAEEDAHE